jgi:uncharacterized protein (TIGR02284 family)
MTESTGDTMILNTLIATTIDSINGYRESAEEVESPRLRELFTKRATERSAVVEQLRGEVSRLGGNPEDDGTILAAGHRAFLNLKAAVVSRDDKAVLNEVERGEDYLKTKYEAALNDGKLAPQSRTLVETAFASVRAGHDEMSALKHSMEA